MNMVVIEIRSDVEKGNCKSTGFIGLLATRLEYERSNLANYRQSDLSALAQSIMQPALMIEATDVACNTETTG